MLVPGQTFKVKWHQNNKEWYISRGYTFTNYKDEFEINAEDITRGSKIKLKAICDYCGETFGTYAITYRDAIDNYPFKMCCGKCADKKTKEIVMNKNKEKNWPKLEQFCLDKGYELITSKDEYDGLNMRIKYKCPKHGIRDANLYSIINLNSGCRLCSDENTSLQLRFTPDHVEKVINSKNGNILLNKKDYCGCTNKNLKVLCGKCGKNIFLTSYTLYTGDGATTCSKCSKIESRNEHIISEFLKANNISFISQYRFDDCRDIKPLPFDFYIEKYNLCIEYDGEQHYDSYFYDTRFDNSQEMFEKTKLHDKIKDEYCKSHGINLLRIPYWEKENIETLILNKIKELESQVA